MCAGRDQKWNFTHSKDKNLNQEYELGRQTAEER